MNKFYAYILPIASLILFFGISVFINNEFILYVGWVITLGWLNRVAVAFQNKVLRNSTIIAFVGTVIWTAGLLFWTSGW